MQILVVTNRYPPYYTGGYELNCREAVEGLRGYGHRVRVLTSTWGTPAPSIERDGDLEIYRTLTPCFDFWLKRHHLFFSLDSLWRDRRAAAHAVQNFQPDVIFVWNMDWTSIAALFHLQQLGKPMVYEFGAPWLCTYVERAKHLRRDPFFRLFRFLSGQTWGWDYRKLRINLAICMTNFIKQELVSGGWIKKDSPIVPQGFDLGEWPYRPDEINPEQLRLLYVGRLDPQKGIDTLVEALPAVKQKYPQATLTISSAASDSSQNSSQEYRHKLEQNAQALGVAESISFVQTPRADLANLYSCHSILVFPSIWQEPFGLIPLEAMACGTPVVATGTGGSGEYLRDRENCLLFSPRNADELTQAILQLASDRDLQQKLRQNGRALVERDCRLETTIERTEKILQNLVK